MVKSTMNQLSNVTNKYQTDAKRVLSICSAGMLRSPTVSNVLYAEYGYNTRSCGASDFALIPLSLALIMWADEIVIVDNSVLRYITQDERELMGDKVVMLSIPDDYEWNNDELVDIIKKQYSDYLDNKK